jgi:hypothetical protein
MMQEVKVDTVNSPKGTFLSESMQFFIKSLLREGDVKVTFIKKDGTERVMECTLKEKSIPEDKQPKGEGPEKTKDVVAVFDIEKQEWRSFRWDSIRRVEHNNG